jgi:hypothetical protein
MGSFAELRIGDKQILSGITNVFRQVQESGLTAFKTKETTKSEESPRVSTQQFLILSNRWEILRCTQDQVVSFSSSSKKNQTNSERKEKTKSTNHELNFTSLQSG